MTKKKTKEYTIEDVKSVKRLRERTGESVRKIAKRLSIPKSVVGRWIKEPVKYAQKYSFRDAKRRKPWLTERDRRRFLKMEQRILNEPIKKQCDLIIVVDDDDTYTLEYM